MNLPPDVHKALLAGAARVPLGSGSVDAALAPVLAPAPGLWQLVAATDLWQRAGFTPPQAQAMQAAPCPAAATCPRAAERVLHMIMAGVHAEQLATWLALAHRHGMAVPHGMLAPLLELGTQKTALQVDLARVLGERGHWLVAQHPEWSAQYGTAGMAAPETHWQLGSLAQRADALRALRRIDPAAAVAALDAEWANEPLENRAVLLPILALGLGLHDEAFLERVLDDKRKEVRAWAQRLLVALPGAQLVERCKARLQALIGVPPALAVTLPAACDKAMKRDGIGVVSHPGLGEKAGWLFDMMCCVPPVHWSAMWQLAPRQVADLFAHHEFHDALLKGLVHACGRTIGEQPAQAAIDWYVLLASEAVPATASFNAATILQRGMPHLPPADQERIVLRWLDAPTSRLRVDARALQWAEMRFIAIATALPPALSQRMLADLQRTMLAVELPGYETARDMDILGRTLDPDALATAQANWPAADWDRWPQWRDLVDKLIDTLQFRTTMHASFLETDE